MRRLTIAAATAILLGVACGQSETTDDRLIAMEKRLAVAEERIAAYEREVETPTATPTPAPTATPTPETTAGVAMRSDIWPELHYDGVLSDDCRERIVVQTVREGGAFTHYLPTLAEQGMGTATDYDRESIEFILSAPFRSWPKQLYYEVNRSLVRLKEAFEEEVAYPIEWSYETRRYHVTLPEGTQTDSVPRVPCGSDRARVERFDSARWDWGGGDDFRSGQIPRVLDTYWRECLPWHEPSTICDDYRIAYGWLLHPWP